MDEAKRTLTNADIESLIKAFDERFASKQQFEDLEKKIDLLPNKVEYFSNADELYTEVKAEREENDVQHETLNDHEQRITLIEINLSLGT